MARPLCALCLLLLAGLAACSDDDQAGAVDAGDDAGNLLPLCGEASASIRYSFPGESPVEICAALADGGFGVVYSASGLAPTMGSCTLTSAGARTALASTPSGGIYWQFVGFNSDWYAQVGRVALALDTDLTLIPGDCPPPPGGGAGGSCRYSSYAAEGGGCRFDVRQAGSTSGDREEVVLAETCPLWFGSDPSQPAPTIEAMHMQSPIALHTVNREDPSQPPRFECPL